MNPDNYEPDQSPPRGDTDVDDLGGSDSVSSEQTDDSLSSDDDDEQEGQRIIRFWGEGHDDADEHDDDDAVVMPRGDPQTPHGDHLYAVARRL